LRWSSTSPALPYLKQLGFVKYEEVYLKAYDSIGEARASLDIYFNFYNTERRHQRLDRRTPDSVYYEEAVVLTA
jgi:putative transposase